MALPMTDIRQSTRLYPVMKSPICQPMRCGSVRVDSGTLVQCKAENAIWCEASLVWKQGDRLEPNNPAERSYFSSSQFLLSRAKAFLLLFQASATNFFFLHPLSPNFCFLWHHVVVFPLFFFDRHILRSFGSATVYVLWGLICASHYGGAVALACCQVSHFRPWTRSVALVQSTETALSWVTPGMSEH